MISNTYTCCRHLPRKPIEQQTPTHMPKQLMTKICFQRRRHKYLLKNTSSNAHAMETLPHKLMNKTISSTHAANTSWKNTSSASAAKTCENTAHFLLTKTMEKIRVLGNWRPRTPIFKFWVRSCQQLLTCSNFGEDFAKSF